MEKGWKPMPVLIKIIWALLVIETFSAIFVISSVSDAGFFFLSFSLYGKIAVNVFFIVKIALPVILIIGMHQRFGWIWIFALCFYLLFAANAIVNMLKPDFIIHQFLEQMPDIPEGFSEEMYFKLLHWTVTISLITVSMVDLAIVTLFVVKRKYFTGNKPVDSSSDEEMNG